MAECANNKYRKVLPVPMFEKQDFNMVSILKGCIGKELSKITMPVHFNEPLSFLQRMVEYMEYSHLLRLASEQDDPADRMKYIAAFAVSATACNWDRLGKPFNPLLGETYEIERPEFRCLCEQVSHHPPISAFHADSPSFTFHGSIYPKLKFWGKSVEIQPRGLVTVTLPKWGETYTWTNVNCTIHNIIVGKLWIEQYGTMEITNHKTGHRAVLQFKPGGSVHKDLHRVEGTIQNKDKKKLQFVYGRWTEILKSTDMDSYEEYLRVNPNKFKRQEERSKSPSNESPAHTPRKVLSKLNSLKMSSFRSLSIQDDSHEATDRSPEPDGDVPRSLSIYSIEIPNSMTLWEVEPRPQNSGNYFSFTNFAMSLNEIEPSMKPPTTLCPTDSRLRPDIRKLEEGDIDGAIAEKNRLEEKQRDARRARKAKAKGTDDWQARWFKLEMNPLTKQEEFVFVGGFWDRKNDNLDMDLF